MNRERGKKPKAAMAGDVLAAVLKRAGLTDQARQLQIRKAWADAVGPEIAASTTPLSFRRGTLLVKTATAAWQNELTFLAATIIEKLNADLGAEVVHNLKVLAGNFQPRSEARPEPGPTPTAESWAAARQAAAPINDPEIRQAFEKMMAAGLAASRSPVHGPDSNDSTSSE